MKRFITTLAILLVVVVAGMTALVLLVNPNDFRAYMVQQVEQRSGYRLELDGNLRWHVWPQLSILSGQMSLTAPGAQQPVVSASTMRLDVKLLPLLSHQLAVKQVLLDGAVVRLTPGSTARQPDNAPPDPTNAAPSLPAQRWTFDIDNLRVSNSLLIWQQSVGKELNVRDLNLQLTQNRQRQAHLELSSRISRDQRELLMNLNADVNLSRYPQHLSAQIQQLDYQLSGADLPKEGLKGQAKMQADWSSNQAAFSLKNLSLSANDSEMTGSASGTLGLRPEVNLDLHSTMLNMDSLLGLQISGSDDLSLQAQRSGPAPVIAVAQPEEQPSVLSGIDGQLSLSVDKLRWRGMDFDRLMMKLSGRDGQFALSTLRGDIGNGNFSLPGALDFRHPQTRLTLQPVLQNIAIAPLMKAFELPATLSGDLSLTGNFSGAGLNVPAFKQVWHGDAALNLSNANIAGLNLQRMIQRAVENSSARVHGPAKQAPGSDMQQITGKFTLNNGLVNFAELNGQSSMLNYHGQGSVNMVSQQADILFGVTVTQGWQGDDELVQRLKQTPVPLRIYGPWSGLNYGLQVDSVLRQQLQDEARKRLKQWSDRNTDSSRNGSVQKLMKDL